MKKYLLLFIAAISLTFVGCNYEDDIDPPNYVSFEDDSMDLVVDEGSSASLEITVYAANETGSDRMVPLNVAGSSSLDPAAYTVPANVTIPANGNEATFTVEVSDTNISNSGESLVLSLGGDAELHTGNNISIDVTRNCPSNLEGTYTVLSSGSSTDAAPVNNPIEDFAYEVEVVKTGDKTYTISDGFAGLYIEWYCEAYGTCAEFEGNFRDVCGNLSGAWVGPFESDVSLTGTDNGDGTLTITWENGFGDTATSTYTKVE